MSLKEPAHQLPQLQVRAPQAQQCSWGEGREPAASRAHSQARRTACGVLCAPHRTSPDPGLAAPHPQLRGPSPPESRARSDRPSGGSSPPAPRSCPSALLPCARRGPASVGARREYSQSSNSARARSGEERGKGWSCSGGQGAAERNRRPSWSKGTGNPPSPHLPTPAPDQREDPLRKPGRRPDALTSELPSQAGRSH